MPTDRTTSDSCQLAVTVVVPYGEFHAVVTLFRWLHGPTRVLPGYLGGFLSRELPDCDCDRDRVRFETEWRSRADLERFVASSHFAPVLTALDLSVDAPEVRVQNLVDRRGIDYVAAIRGKNGDNRALTS